MWTETSVTVPCKATSQPARLRRTAATASVGSAVDPGAAEVEDRFTRLDDPGGEDAAPHGALGDVTRGSHARTHLLAHADAATGPGRHIPHGPPAAAKISAIPDDRQPLKLKHCHA